MTTDVTGMVFTILDRFERFGTDHVPNLDHMTYGRTVTLCLPGDSTRITLPCISYLPALVAVHKGYPASVVRKMLDGYDIQPANLLGLAFPDSASDFKGSALNAFDLSRLLLVGSEANKWPEAYQPEVEIELPMKIAMLSSANSANWMPERLSRLSARLVEGTADARDFLNLDIDDTGYGGFGNLDEARFPNANKVDFAQRMGFFSEVLASKRLSAHGHYESLLEHAYASDACWKGSLEFYFKRLPPPQKEAFIRGFETSIPCLTPDGLDNASVSYAYQWLIDETSKWEVSEPLDSVTMKLNYLPTVHVTKASSYISDTTAFNDLLESPQDSYARLAHEIAGLAPEQFCLAHFHAFLQIERQGYPQHTEEIDPHEMSLRALQALDHFCLAEGLKLAEKKHKVDQIARNGVRALIKELVRTHDFDHSIFKEQSSRNVALLVEAGLDPRQLPKMKHTDMAKAFTAAMGI